MVRPEYPPHPPAEGLYPLGAQLLDRKPGPEPGLLRGLLVGVLVSFPLWVVAFIIVQWVGEVAGWW